MAALKPLNILITLHRGYGLGDAAQMSAVLRHVVKARSHWHIDLVAEEGRHCIGRGIVENTFAFGNSPNPSKVYDAEVEILLFDTWASWGYKPNTRVSSCLHDRFGLEWDRDCGRYQINIRPIAKAVAARVIDGEMVAVHYRGDSSPTKKNLTHEQAATICEHILEMGYTPLLLDWRNESPLVKEPGIHTTGGYSFSQEWGRDAEMNCAVISQCEAFVGIDSGPSKCASATDTPTLVTWTGHHPAPFHDPAPNTTHLVPKNYHGLFPVCDDKSVIEFFEANYLVRQYNGNPVTEIKKWLTETLK